MVLRRSSLFRNNTGLSEVISSVILTSVMMVIIITSTYYANDTVTYNVESVQFDQAVNAVLSLERMAKKMMFRPQSTGSVKTSFVTTCPYMVEEGTLVILIDGDEIESLSMSSFKIEGGQRVGVSTNYSYIGNNSSLLEGLDGSLSHVLKYQSNGVWVSLDFNRIRCVYCGEMNYYNGTNPDPVKRNVVEITVVRLSSGEISPLERSRIILENTGINTTQISHPAGDFPITVRFAGVESEPVFLSDLGGNATLSTVVNLTIIDMEITVLGGG